MGVFFSFILHIDCCKIVNPVPHAFYRLVKCIDYVYASFESDLETKVCEQDDLHTKLLLCVLWLLASAAHTPQGLKRTNARSLLRLHSILPRLQRKETGAWPIRSADRSADDQMTDKRKLFKTLISRQMLVYKFRCFYRLTPKRTARLCCSLSSLDLSSLNSPRCH